MGGKAKKPNKRLAERLEKSEYGVPADLPMEERQEPSVAAEELREGFFISEQHFRQTMYRMLRDIQEAQTDQAELLGQLIRERLTNMGPETEEQAEEGSEESTEESSSEETE